MIKQDHSLLDNQSVPSSIWAIGIASFLINASSVIVFGLSAVYMKTILGVATGWIGLLEGAVEACAYSVKVLSGIFSDYLRRRKKIMVFGFALVTLARPLLALSSSFGTVFTSRVFDRIGNGIQSTPRDALVGDLSPPAIKGRCYGLRQSLATAGSFFGGIVGVAAMYLTNQDFHKVFWLATIPAVLGLIIVISYVKDSPLDSAASKKERQPLRWADLSRLSRPYWVLMGVVGIFMLARVSEALLILHAHQTFHLPETYTPLVLILYNGTNSLASYPIGYLSDRMNRYILLGVGFFLLIGADLLLATAPNLAVMLCGVALWGIQIGMTQSLILTLIVEHVPEDLRGTGFGIFYLISALSLLIAGSLGGTIAQLYHERVAFTVSGGVGTLALLSLVFLMPYLSKVNKKKES